MGTDIGHVASCSPASPGSLWQVEAAQLLEEHHLAAWAHHPMHRRRFGHDLAAYLGGMDETQVCELPGMAIRDMFSFCNLLERSIRNDRVRRSIDAKGGIVDALRLVSDRSKPMKRRYFIWHDADVLLKYDHRLFGRLADAIMGVSAELEYTSEDLLLLQRVVFVGGALPGRLRRGPARPVPPLVRRRRRRAPLDDCDRREGPAGPSLPHRPHVRRSHGRSDVGGAGAEGHRAEPAPRRPQGRALTFFASGAHTLDHGVPRAERGRRGGLRQVVTMRIIAGEFRHRKLISPPDAVITRPIPDRAKESMFNLLRGWTEGRGRPRRLRRERRHRPGSCQPRRLRVRLRREGPADRRHPAAEHRGARVRGPVHADPCRCTRAGVAHPRAARHRLDLLRSPVRARAGSGRVGPRRAAVLPARSP